MTGAPALVWFRLDLRLADNDALLQALAAHPAIVPVFIWAPEEETPWQPGAASRWWLHHSLVALEKALAENGSKLIVRRGPTEAALRELAAETGARAIYWNRRYEPAVIARDREIKQRLNESGIAAESLPGNLLWEPWTLRNRSGKPFLVFTPFWRACLAMPAPSAPKPAPPRIPAPVQWPSSLTIDELGLLPKIDWAAGLRDAWQPGESAASARMRSFLEDCVASYAAERDRPDHRGTSRLSPYLHFGEVSARQIWHAASGRDADAEPYLRQIVWREFAHHLLFHFPHTPTEPLRPEFRAFPWQFDARLMKAWTRGRTGYPLVDAGMRELWHTGWMHNRVRMIAAGFLVKHLLLPWQEGAAWFWDTLVDADLANNTLGWQWAAGCGADAAPYFRIFNPRLQAERFDPAGEYRRRWAPEPQDPIVDHAAARARALAAFASIKKP
jgi:deoxyribodipyrimidine photo-lyase